MTLPRTSAILILLFLASVAGCNRQERLRVETVEEPDSLPASVIHVADPRTERQLVSGFHELEQNSWRWTQGKFSLILQPPAGAAEKGATLQLKFSIPPALIERLSAITVSASVNGTALPPETFQQPGDYVYSRDVPASALGQTGVAVDFSLDRFLAAGAVEPRELGLVVNTIGLIAK